MAGSFSSAHHELEGAVDRDGVDLQQHFSRSGRGRGNFLKAQHFRRSELVKHDRLHALPPDRSVV
jgi:hypothetical protein